MYVATFAVVKRWRAVPKRFEMLLAAGLTAVANVLVALGSGTPLFPALSACASGAWIAMVAHNFMVKNARATSKEEAAPPPEKPENHV